MIWWLVSYPKSGNTWMRMFLNAYVTGFPVDLNSAWQYCMGDLVPMLYQTCVPVPLQDLVEGEQFYYRPAALLTATKLTNTRDICLKTHHANADVDGIPLCPKRLSKGALYIIRDPRDVAISFADHCNMTIDESIKQMGNVQQVLCKEPYRLFHILTSWSAHVDSWTVLNETIPTTVIRYEDMIDDTESTMRVALDGLGFDPIDEERLAFAIRETSFENLQDKERTKSFRENGKGDRFFRKGTHGQWKDILSDEQVAKIEYDHKETMQRHAYPLAQEILVHGD